MTFDGRGSSDFRWSPGIRGRDEGRKVRIGVSMCVFVSVSVYWTTSVTLNAHVHL